MNAFLALLVVSFSQDQIDGLVEKYQLENSVVGMSVVALKNGVIVSEQYRGFSDLNSKTPVDKNTRMRLASISKSVAATVAMRLVQEGKLNLDYDVRKYVPEWPDKGQLITLRQILSHRSGIRHYQTGKSDKSSREISSREALTFFNDDPLLFNPGTKYSYSTHAFTLLAACIESGSQKSFPQFVQDLASSNGLSSLTCENQGSQWPDWRSKHYFVSEKKPLPSLPTENLSWKYAGGGMECTAYDLAQFGQRLLDGKILNSSHLSEMWTDPEGDGYALGWATKDHLKSHSGSQQGAQSFLMIDTKNKVVISVLTNTVPNSPSQLAESIYQVILKGI